MNDHTEPDHAKAFIDAVKTEAATLALEALDEVLLKWMEDEAKPGELTGLDRARTITRALIEKMAKVGWGGSKKEGAK